MNDLAVTQSKNRSHSKRKMRPTQKVYFESASRAFQNGSEAVKTPRCGEALYMTVCASSELGGFAAY